MSSSVLLCRSLLLSLSLGALLPARAGETGSGNTTPTQGTPSPGATTPSKQDTPSYIPPPHIIFSPSNYPSYWEDFGAANRARERRSFGDFINTRVQLPAEIPVLGAPLPVVLRKGDPGLTVLHQAIAEPFFTPLTALLRKGGGLSGRQVARVEAYAARRARSLEALRSNLAAGKVPGASLPGCDDASLVAQEAEAELMRAAMAEETDNIRWTERDSWIPATDEPVDRTKGESSFLLALSYFQSGLSQEQRELLREMAQGRPAGDAGHVLCFSPFGARFRLPEGLGAGTMSLISEYEVLKGSLGGELMRALHDNEGTWFEGVRIRRLEELQAVQRARFQRLDELAEGIRVALTGVTLPDEPQGPVLSSTVRQSLAEYLHSKTQFQRALVSSIAGLKERFPSRGIELAREEGRVVVVLREGYGQAAATAAKELTDRIQADYAALDQKRRAVTEAIAAESATRGEPRPVSLDQLAGDFAKALMRQETWARYEDYRTAVLSPGLSPRQRRLLFAETLRALDPVSLP
jgi:hypothetical protein